MRLPRPWLLPIAAWGLILPGLAAGWQTEPVGLRLILVETEAEAVELRARIQAGASFEELAREHSLDPSAASGGYLGTMAVADLRQEFRDALGGVGPGEISPVARFGDAYVLLHRMAPEEAGWMAKNDAGLRALQQGRLVEAVELFKEAILDAEELGPADRRLGESLNNLAAIYRLQGDYARAEPLYRRSLAIREQTLGPEHLDVAASLNSLAEVQRFQQKYAEAEPLYRRSLSILEQVLGPEHPNVGQSLNNLAQLLHARQQYAEAEALSRRSLAITERALGPDHLDVATSLNNLARILQAQEHHAGAEPLYRRSLAILEQAVGPAHPNVAQSLSNLARVLEAEGNYPEAAQLYRRSLEVRWGRPSGAGPAGVPALLERFTDVMSLAYFLDETFEEAFRDFEQAIAGAPIREDLYRAMSALLVEVARKEEAEAVMLRAIEAYPDSWRARYELGEVYMESMKLQSALESMEAAIRMSSSPAPDRRQQSFLYRRIGDIQSELFQFEAAEASYRRALELDPDRVESRLALGDLYLGENKLEEALAAYTEVILADPANAFAHTGLAEVNLRLRQFPESVAAAEKALEIDPGIRAARYHRARALIQMGERDEGQTELQAYQSLQAEGQAAEERGTNVYVLNRDAADRLVAGEGEEAIRLLREGAASHSGEPAFHFNLGVVQSRLGRHDEAAATLQAMIDMEIGDDFLTRRNLAREYELLGNTAAGERHRTAYLQKIEAELRSRVE